MTKAWIVVTLKILSGTYVLLAHPLVDLNNPFNYVFVTDFSEFTDISGKLKCVKEISFAMKFLYCVVMQPS